MAYIHAIAAGQLELALYAVSLLVSALPEKILSLIWMRGFGRRGFGRRYCQMLWIEMSSRGVLLLASLHQLSIDEHGSGSHQGNQMMSV
jgi:hypothetical protein